MIYGNLFYEVLILVLMEDTLRVDLFLFPCKHACLNPCFNGRYSQSRFSLWRQQKESLNPCFNGRYSQRLNNIHYLCTENVLILVLMEDTLRVKKSSGRRSKNLVLILVLMEDTLRVKKKVAKYAFFLVLILVLMEDTLRAKQQ